jgi:double-strand break repair protein MRE11
LRKYCFGTKPVEFDIVSDEKTNFGHTGFPFANFNDPNLNVSIPVFIIHGNHDDPTGASNLCALDIIASAGLINYFGKSITISEQIVDISPILLEKGCTKLAIYGLGSVKDERLYDLLFREYVQFVRPDENKDDWFNIFCIHQNRTARGKKNSIPEEFLPNFLDLVLWGHEHECRIRPEFNVQQKFYVTQPGSSVITALCDSEVAPKHVGILKVYKNNFNLEPIPLRTVRQFVTNKVVISDLNINPNDLHIDAKVEQFLLKRAKKLIQECNKERNDTFPDQIPELPLIRIKVDYTGFEHVSQSPIRFGRKFFDIVANPLDILLYTK